MKYATDRGLAEGTSEYRNTRRIRSKYLYSAPLSELDCACDVRRIVRFSGVRQSGIQSSQKPGDHRRDHSSLGTCASNCSYAISSGFSYASVTVARFIT
jgi:hypothetical protein